ncbi:MAG: ParB/RepB/Spo0J family partition protein [Acidobacteria bacterium]|nr:ParB/RepB/Spo0J family partition protein [Acidobacteriota bacterium]MBI3425615.1 ParB/RepB/Spo0J family partition protein [Acidobacteriota bacterium]
MKSKKIASSAEEMRARLFNPATQSQAAELPPDRLKAYLDYVGKTVTVPLDLILIEDNVRKQVDTNSPKFQELVESIKREGLLQNLVVDVRTGASGTYLSCVSGQRRLLAAKIAGVEKAVCLLKQYSEGDRVSIGLTENLVRQDLHCIDVADGYAELHRAGWSEEEIADRFERGQRTIHRYLLIAAWPEDVKQKIRANPDLFTTRVIFNDFVSRGFANDAELQAAVDAKITNSLQKTISNASINKSNQRTSLTQETRHGIKMLGDKLQTSIKVKTTGDKGRLEIAFVTEAELRRLLELLVVN